MFSAAFPLAAVCAAVGNFIELRIDAFKLVSQSRRPRYAGAEDIGSWEGVVNTISWIALPVNVLILVFTSWDFRRLFVVPLVLGGSRGAMDCAHAKFDALASNYTAADGSVRTFPASMFVSHHAAAVGGNWSYLASCTQNVDDCFANIGGEPWLHGVDYMSPNSTYTIKYMQSGLCNPDSLLYNHWHCDQCTSWTAQVQRAQWVIVVFVEHLLLLFKLLIAYLIPDQPQWITDAVARKQFDKEMREREENRKRRSTMAGGMGAMSVPERESAAKQLVKEINTSDDTIDRATLFSSKV